MPGFSSIAWVILGGGLGSAARFALQRWAVHFIGTGFPYGTLLVNIVGSLLIGFFYQLSLRDQLVPDNFKLFLMTGFCGGFTTFSAITLESMVLLQQHKWVLLLIYILSSLLAGIVATLLGYWMTKTLLTH